MFLGLTREILALPTADMVDFEYILMVTRFLNHNSFEEILDGENIAGYT